MAREVLDKYLSLGGHRRTPERYAILDAVYGEKGLFTLDELGERLVKEKNLLISRPSLYNAINLFLELRLVVRYRMLNSTLYEASMGRDDSCYCICTVCGKIKGVTIPDVGKAIDEAKLSRFRREGYSLTVYGICSSCQAKITRQKNKENKQKYYNKDERKS